MFYPCKVDLDNTSLVRQGIIVLTPAESRRLLAKAVAACPNGSGPLPTVDSRSPPVWATPLCLRNSRERGSNHRFSVGMSAAGMLTMSLEEGRVWGRFFLNGEVVNTPYLEFLKSLGKGDVVIKGADAVDPAGNVGVLMSNETGGAVGAMFGPASARGIPVIVPVGLEKQIASVPDAAAGWGQLTLATPWGSASAYRASQTGWSSPRSRRWASWRASVPVLWLPEV